MVTCLKKIIAGFAVLLSLLTFVSPALAAAPDGLGPWADSVVSVHQGLMKNGLPVPAIRSDPTSALGVAEGTNVDGTFIALGFGGVITLGFDNGVSNGAMVVEATNPGYPDENAKIEMSADGTHWVAAGNLADSGTVSTPEGLSCAKYVRITDTSDPNNFSDATADGYDVDGVKATGDPCTPPVAQSCTCPSGDVTQTNSTSVTTIVNITSNSGKNKSNGNTGGNTSITTGNASSSASVSVGGSTNTVTGSGCCCGGNTSVTISGNGAGSFNFVNIGKGIKKLSLH